MEAAVPTTPDLAPAALPPGVAVDADGRLQSDVACAFCGYSLRGAAAAGSCPECGERVADSLRAERLGLGDPRWVRTVRRGLLLIVAAAAIDVPLIIAFVALPRFLPISSVSPAFAALRLVALVGSVVACVGVWWVTKINAGAAGRGLAYPARVAAILSVVVEPAAFAPALMYPGTGGVTWLLCGNAGAWLSGVAGGVATVLTLLTMANLARRAASPRLSAGCASLAWAFAAAVAARAFAYAAHTVFLGVGLSSASPGATLNGVPMQIIGGAMMLLTLVFLLLTLLLVGVSAALWRRLGTLDASSAG